MDAKGLALALAALGGVGLASTGRPQTGSVNPSSAVPLMSSSPRLANRAVWPITQDGTAKHVLWVDAANPRFAVNDGETNWDDTDDVVLDKETGLIWQRSPTNGSYTWSSARTAGFNHSYVYMTRKGWRLPSVEELTTLMEQYINPSLPAGHPFLNVLSDSYWTATSYYIYYLDFQTQNRTNWSYTVHLNNGAVGWDDKANTHPIWLVRGGRGGEGM